MKIMEVGHHCMARTNRGEAGNSLKGPESQRRMAPIALGQLESSWLQNQHKIDIV